MKITIVGAGTAGALTAAYFKKIYPSWDIIQIHNSVKIPIIGVGESLTPLPVALFDKIGLDESRWIKETGSSFKIGNRFEGWGDRDVNVGFSYNKHIDDILNNKHSDLESMVTISDDKFRLTDVWLDLYLKGKVGSFSESLNEFHTCMENNTAPFSSDGKIISSQDYQHSYHINAEKFAPWIQDNINKKIGVKELIGIVVDVNLDQNGITSVQLDDGRVHTSDYWIDCSGFNRVLISALSTFQKYYHIKTNSATVMPIKYNDKTEMKNYTRTIWNEYGWQFKIGLKERLGTGIIYSDTYFDTSHIEQVLLQKEGPRNLKPPKTIKWTPGKMTRPGCKNVYSIAAASGFIEPMEGNVLAHTVSGIMNSARAIEEASKGKSIKESNDEFNRSTTIFLDDAADFISAHYTLCKKGVNDFWKDMRGIGKDHRHEELLLHKYNHPNNTIKAAYKLLTNFPQHMWIQLAQEFYDLDLSKYSRNTPQHLQDQVLKYIQTKENYCDKKNYHCKNSYSEFMDYYYSKRF